MKTFKILVASVSVAILAVSCQKNVEEIAPVQEKAQLTTITCAFPTMTDQNGTKVSLDALGNTGWQEGDKIAIYGQRNQIDGDSSNPIAPIIHELTASEVINPSVAVFDVDLTDLIPDSSGKYHYNAAYPADDWDFYSEWYSSARARFYETNQILLAGYLDDSNMKMTLLNLCGAIMFKVKGDFDEYQFFGNGNETVGYDDYLVEVNKSTPVYLKKPGESYGTNGPKTKLLAPVNGDGNTINYIFIPNEVNMSSGFTIQFLKNGNIVKYAKSKSSLSLVHGHCVNLGTIPDSAIYDYVAPTGHDATHPAINGATDLGAGGTSNCYIVDASVTDNKEKVFKFKAVKGNSSVGVGSIADVVVLWETYNNADAVENNSVIAEADFDTKDEVNYWITFKMPATLHAGNAVIAAKNSEGDILWSWHIWVPATTISSDDYGIHTSGKNVMDRNLGALVVAEASASSNIAIESIGMFYQWGRKDPFVGPREIIEGEYPSKAKVAGVERTYDKVQISIAESIQQPTFFARGYYNGSTQENPDWCSESSSSLWGDNTSKSEYDPCPPGYRVPNRDSEKALWASDITAQTGWNYNKDHYWFTLGSPATVFPAVGWIDGGSIKTTFRAGIWNAHSDSWVNDYGHGHIAAYARRVYWESSSLKHKNSSVNKSLGYSVRCVAE